MAGKGDDEGFGRRSADLNGVLFSTLIDSVVNMAKTKHEWNKWAELMQDMGKARGDCGTDKAGKTDSGPPVRLRNLSFELAEAGVYGWRDLLQVQKRFQPELTSAQMGPGLAWLDPTAELVPNKPIVYLTPTPETAEGTAFGGDTFVIENRSSSVVELILPRALELERSDSEDKVFIEVGFSPALPVLSPGDQVEVEFTATVPANTFDTSAGRQRYLGRLNIGSRVGLQVQLLVQLTTK